MPQATALSCPSPVNAAGIPQIRGSASTQKADPTQSPARMKPRVSTADRALRHGAGDYPMQRSRSRSSHSCKRLDLVYYFAAGDLLHPPPRALCMFYQLATIESGVESELRSPSAYLCLYKKLPRMLSRRTFLFNQRSTFTTASISPPPIRCKRLPNALPPLHSARSQRNSGHGLLASSQGKSSADSRHPATRPPDSHSHNVLVFNLQWHDGCCRIRSPPAHSDDVGALGNL